MVITHMCSNVKIPMVATYLAKDVFGNTVLVVRRPGHKQYASVELGADGSTVFIPFCHTRTGSAIKGFALGTIITAIAVVLRYICA